MGKAIDEAASWYEQSEWIGVNMTPSADFVYNRSGNSKVWQNHSVELKRRSGWEPFCVDWSSEILDNEDKPIEWLKKQFLKMGPISIDVAHKYTNTIKFIKQQINESNQNP